MSQDAEAKAREPQTKLEVFEMLLQNMFEFIRIHTKQPIETPDVADAIMFIQHTKNETIEELKTKYATVLGPVAGLAEDKQAKLKRYVEALRDLV